METLKTILSRRSIRKYSGKDIPEEHYELLLRAAMYAPSARNRQPWHFIIVGDNKLLLALADSASAWNMLSHASRAIIVCGDKYTEDAESFLIQDCSAATQNILLAAHELGLGAVWLGVHPREDRVKTISELFKLPPNIIPVSMISLGYPDEERQTEERYLSERIHFDKW
ncbi:MAG: nitroreductase family protein [Bacteroidales bacterium]|nr:nitroreductase family protein [Bacteroidales bacterium]